MCARELRRRLGDAAALLQDHSEIVVRLEQLRIAGNGLSVVLLGPIETAVLVLSLGKRREVPWIPALRELSPLGSVHQGCSPRDWHLGASWLTKP